MRNTKSKRQKNLDWSFEPTELLFGGGDISHHYPLAPLKYAVVIGGQATNPKRDPTQSYYEVSTLLLKLEARFIDKQYVLLENANIGVTSPILSTPRTYTGLPVLSCIGNSEGRILGVCDDIVVAQSRLEERLAEFMARDFAEKRYRGKNLEIRRVEAPLWVTQYV
jgi:hypothetical protein